MKQTISGPVAAIIILITVIAGVFVFQRPDRGIPGTGIHSHDEEEQPALPQTPPYEDSERQSMLKGLSPLGLWCVMPPTSEDRFKGARVALVIPQSAANKAGLKGGDLITKFGRVKVTNPYAIIAVLESIAPKTPTPIVVVRNGKELTLTVTGMIPLPLEERVLKRKPQ